MTDPNVAEYVTIEEAARLLGYEPRSVCRMCAQGKFPSAVKDGGCWKIPTMAHPKLTQAGGAESPDDSDTLAEAPKAKRDEAIRRLGIIQEFEKHSAAWVHGGGTRGEALSAFCRTHPGIKDRSLQRWLRRYRDGGLMGLVDMRGGGKLAGQISDEAFEFFKSLYLTQQRLTVAQCWRMTKFASRDKGLGWKMPSAGAMYRHIANRIPRYVQVLHREGLAAYEAKCAPYIEIDPDSVAPGQISVGDHSQFNCWVRQRNRWVRPWVTAWMDMRSREIVGWYISESPNQTTILLAAKRAIEKYGPSDSAKIDNGRDYDSEMWTGTTKAKRRALRRGYIDEQMVAGLYAMMDIAVSFSIPYHPQSKRIERWFDTLDQQFTKTIPTYCGKDTERKPDYLKKLLGSEKAIAEAHDITSFGQVFAEYAEVYNNTAHAGAGMNGRTPAQVMATRSSRRVLAEGVLELLMRVWSGELIVGKNGIKLKGMWYGQYDLELLAHQGRKVRAAYDPDDMTRVYIYDAATMKLVTIAEQAQLVRYGEAVSEGHLREAMKQRGHAVKVARQFRDSRLTANMDITDLAIKAMEDGRQQKPAAETGTLRPVRTPLDGQVREHQRREVVKRVRRAAGGEAIEAVLDMDFSLLNPKPKKTKVRLFGDG